MSTRPYTWDQLRRLALARQLWEGLQTKPELKENADEATLNEAFITAAFEQVLSRSPRSAELALCREFLAKQTALYTENATALAAAKAAATTTRS